MPGKKAGTVKYNNNILFQVIEIVKPISGKQWERVAMLYKFNSGEPNVRDFTDVKRHFYTSPSMCNKHKKITGESDAAKFTKKCLELARTILDKESVAISGGGDEDEFQDGPEEEEEEENEDEDAEHEEIDEAGRRDEDDGSQQQPAALPATEEIAGGGGGMARATKRKVVVVADKPQTKNSKVSGKESPRAGTSATIAGIGNSIASIAQQGQMESMMMMQAQYTSQMMMMMMQQQQQQHQLRV